MKPAAFDYYAPTTVDDVMALLKRHGSDARLLAGGQTLLPMMNFRLAAPEVIIDLNRIPELAFIREAGGQVHIGAMTRQRALEFSPVIAKDLPLLHEAIKMVGHLPTRSRGTIGGSLAEVRFQVMPQGALFAVEEFSRRRGDFAIAAVAAMLVVKDGLCEKARIATAGVSSFSSRLRAAEEILEGRALDADAIRKASEATGASIEPVSDRNASEEYRRHLTRVLTTRVLNRAAESAKPH